MRLIRLTPAANKYAEGSCLVEYGDTKVLCTASIDEKVPSFLRNSGKGWVTAEYGMLPRSTHSRSDREAARGKQSGRTQEIQRLIGRALRSAINLADLGERQIKIDCDVLQADGGTRTAAISGAWVALWWACQNLLTQKLITTHPLAVQVAAVSCGIYQGITVLDLDYAEDSAAETDGNFILTNQNGIIEIQATAEKTPFNDDEFLAMLRLARLGVAEIFALQRAAIAPAIGQK